MIILLSILSLIIIAIVILLSQNLLADIVLVGLSSFFMALLYALMNAPDVATTEAAVNAMLGTTFALITLLSCKSKNTVYKPNNILFAVVVALFTLALILPIVHYFPTFGDLHSPVNNEISNYYISGTIEKLGFTNIVTGILASFRGFDTLIETIVIFTAANSIYMLIGRDETDQ